MNTPESRDIDPYGCRPNAEPSFDVSYFDISYAFVGPDAEHIRLGAADKFQEEVGQRLYERLAAKGVTDDQIDKMAANGLLDDALQRLVPDEMAEIEECVQRTDALAQHALARVVYLTYREHGLTKND